MSDKNVAIVLAGGRGKRMNIDVPKQYLEINGRPLICYTLEAVENSIIDEIVAVVSKGEIEFFQNNIVNKYGYNKVTKIVEGGAERYNSVYNGLTAISEATYVYIHDGARPCVDNEIIIRGYETVKKYKSAVAAVKVKDTIKKVDSEGFVIDTPDRNYLWQIQTPQIFEYEKILNAYDNMNNSSDNICVTDDASVIELYGDGNVKIYEGSYNNIKVTTIEDVSLVERIIKENGDKSSF